MKKNIIKYVLSILFSLITVFLILLIYDIFNLNNKTLIYSALSNAFFVCGVIGLCVGLLILISNFGTFDMIGYGIRKFFSFFKRNPKEVKYNTFQDYKEAKKGRHNDYLYLIIIGFIFIMIGVLFYLLYEGII